MAKAPSDSSSEVTKADSRSAACGRAVRATDTDGLPHRARRRPPASPRAGRHWEQSCYIASRMRPSTSEDGAERYRLSARRYAAHLRARIPPILRDDANGVSRYSVTFCLMLNDSTLLTRAAVGSGARCVTPFTTYWPYNAAVPPDTLSSSDSASSSVCSRSSAYFPLGLGCSFGMGPPFL